MPWRPRKHIAFGITLEKSHAQGAGGSASKVKHAAILARLCGVDSGRFFRFRTAWIRSHGSLIHESWGKKQVTTWLAERPGRRGGPWGIGCIFCASLMDRCEGKMPEPQVSTDMHAFQAYSV
jgi:hypothetical protein